MSFAKPFRHYQELALDAFEDARRRDDQRIYLTMPPGSGKTVLGLEIARRTGNPTVVLAPTAAIQAQWIAEWASFLPAWPAESGLGGDAPVHALTYQSVCIVGPEMADGAADDEAATEAAADAAHTDDPPDARERARRRQLIMRGGDPDAVLGLLHANGRALVDRLAAMGPITLVLDECHHLLQLWGHVLSAVIAAIDPGSLVVGLTATPPDVLTAAERTLHEVLFGGHADFQVVTPAVVKDGYLAPYQELALFVQPLDAEQRFIDRVGERFERLRSEVLDADFATVGFGAWFATRIVERRALDGAPVGWEVVERADPALAQASLRWCWHQHMAPPSGAHIREQHRQPPDTPDWMALFSAYVRDVLDVSAEEVDAVARQHIQHALPTIGYRLTRNGIVAATSVVGRVLGASAAKPAAVVRILDAESRVLGAGLRAAVLCDFERAGPDPGSRLRDVLHPGAGSAALMLRTLLDDERSRALDPVLVTGRTVACSRRTAADLGAFAADDPTAGPMLAGFDPLAARGRDAGAAGWWDMVLIEPDASGWTPRVWVPLVTRFLEQGRTRCVVGTRALLGEGWDCRSLNVLIDLGAATTRISVQQVRGRTLRLDPADPRKVADNWDVVCVAPDQVQGASDYDRFVRRHAEYYALNQQGEVESGVSHVDSALTPFAPPAAAALDGLQASMLARVGERAAVHAAWRIGQPYRDIPVQTVRVRMGRSPGVPSRDLWRTEPLGRTGVRVRNGVVTGLGAAALIVVLGFTRGIGLLGLALGLLVALLTVAWALAATRRAIARLGPSDTLGDMGRAIAEALAATGLIEATLGPASVRVTPQPDGYYRCAIEGATEPDSARFAAALEDVVAPLWEPRWIIPRRVVVAPPTVRGAFSVATDRTIGRVRPMVVVHHAVPDVLGTRQERVAVFGESWRRWVSPGAHPMRATDAAALRVLDLHRGDDPFQVETQQRRLWT